jgi:hypothetical protein
MSFYKIVVCCIGFIYLTGCAVTADPKTYNGQYMQMLTSSGQFQMQWNLPDERTCANMATTLSNYDILGRSKSFCIKDGNPNTTHVTTALLSSGEAVVMEFIGLGDCNKYTADAPSNNMKVIKFCQKK